MTIPVCSGVLVKLNSSDPKLEKVLQCPMPCSTLNALSSALTAASEHGVLELGAGETGLVGLVASKLWRQSCGLSVFVGRSLLVTSSFLFLLVRPGAPSSVLCSY